MHHICLRTKIKKLFLFQVEQIKEDAQTVCIHIKIQVLEQERTTKAKAALEGSVYIKENTISGDRTKNEDRRNGLDS